MLITPDTWSKQPWKNGRGVTHEIWRWTGPARLPTDEYDLRISVALIDGAQAFSLFPGYFRALVPLDESALVLGSKPLVKHRIYELSGDEPIATTGSGKTRDLNVISRVARARARVEIGTSEHATTATHLAIVALEDAIVRDASGAAHELRALDTWIALDAGTAAFSASSPVVWIRF